MITRCSFTRVITQSPGLAILSANGFGLGIVKANLSILICSIRLISHSTYYIEQGDSRLPQVCSYTPLLHVIFQGKSGKVAHRTKPFLVKSTFKCSHDALLLMELIQSGTLLGALIHVNLSLVVGEQE